jgi:DNA-binding transcriptional MerR regulator
MDTFSTAQVAKRFGVADQTVKNWASEFAQYLSPTATPEAGKRRAFTAEDVAILALVHEMVGRGRDTSAAHAALQAGRRGAVNALTMATEGDSLVAVQRERDMLQGAVIELRTMLDKATTDRDELLSKLARAQLRIELLESGELKPKGK